MIFVVVLPILNSRIDYNTDTIIQESLRKELGKDVTVITIAHRLRTIMDADKIVCATPFFLT
jgi:ABC-type multidrug transport system fused ATPase/permease subunit